MDASSVNFIRRLDKIQHDRAETTDRNVFRPLDVGDMRQGAVVRSLQVTSNGAQNRIEILLKTHKLSFGRLGRRDHLFDVFSRQLNPKGNGLSRDRSHGLVAGEFQGSFIPS